ncbi:MAG TPA: biopolymer transporter ExbD [Rhabdochlamydiaceae bacterium]|jgi:biopolymer transport protein ExbD|nr:biopolymer transporter ExbD [Rhabdochlamydiaceae bacterium]
MRRHRIASHRQDPFEEATINLTPLIDVVFVVLIIFIIIAPMLELDRVELAQAAATPNKQAANPESSPLAIHVHQDNTIWFNGKCVTIEQLTTILKTLRQQGSHKIPQLFQDKRAFFGTYQNVKNAVEVAGFDELDIILKPGS